MHVRNDSDFLTFDGVPWGWCWCWCFGYVGVGVGIGVGVDVGVGVGVPPSSEYSYIFIFKHEEPFFLTLDYKSAMALRNVRKHQLITTAPILNSYSAN